MVEVNRTSIRSITVRTKTRDQKTSQDSEAAPVPQHLLKEGSESTSEESESEAESEGEVMGATTTSKEPTSAAPNTRANTNATASLLPSAMTRRTPTEKI